MIKKILKIENVGKFKSFPSSTRNSGHWPEELKKAVLIYGENGTGKTTLAHLFKSLQAGNAHINKKKSFGATGDYLVELRIEGCNGLVKFDGTTWSHPCDDLEIFDSHFISENVFTGHEIQANHEKNLFELIIGKRGVGLKGTITGIKTVIEETNDLVRKAKLAISTKTGDSIKPEAFVKLKPDADLIAKLMQVEAELEKVRNLAAIKRTPSLTPLQALVPPYPLDNLRKVFPFTIEQISAHYLLLLNTHKEHLTGIDDKNGWLAAGWKNVQTQTEPHACPFCQQPINEQIDIIKAYSLYFNDKYAALKVALDKMALAFGPGIVQQMLSATLETVVANTKQLQFWQPYIGNIELTADSLVQAIKTDLTTQAEQLLQDTLLKKQDLNLSLPTTTTEAYALAIESANQLINDYNLLVVQANDAITQLKTGEGTNEGELLKRKAALQLQQLRMTEEMEQTCEDYLALSVALAAHKKQMDSVKQQLETYAQTTLTQYAGKINDYLAQFAPYIKIEKLKHEYRGSGKEPYATYGLLVHDNEVSFTEQAHDGPSLKYALSEGDKSALAFSFFLAKLDLDGTLADKIIVFDDPISSFDAGRKTATIWVLSSLSKKVKQLIVLTHNLFFANELLERLESNSTAVPCLSLKIWHSTAGSILKEHELDTEATLGFLKDFGTLTDFLDGSAALDENGKRAVIKCIRTVLEGYLRFKFLRKLKKGEWLGNALDKIRTADTRSAFYRLQPHLETLETLNDYSKGFHHASLSMAEAESINDAELKLFAQKTIDVVQHI
ncbi:MAG: hypothetical protein EOO60_03115 [Hymenobacter sp.]|nr:MAG: hypothetical protein EOO60_03115 [Hymenobacter sp.]